MKDPQAPPRPLTRFGEILRRMRKAKGYRHRVIAKACGMSYSTAANMECAPHKTIGLDRVHSLAQFYQLPAALSAQLVEAWHELPMSEYHQKNRQKWERRNAVRRKSKLADALQQSLVDVLGLLITVSPADQVCACVTPEIDPFTDEPKHAVRRCEICEALILLGLDTGWSTESQVIKFLCSLQKADDTPIVSDVDVSSESQSKTP